MIEIEAPDGTVVEFPDGTSDDVIKSVMAKNFGGPSGPQYRDRGAFSAASEAASDVFGFGDELAAGLFAAGESTIDALRGKGFNYVENYKRIYGNLDRMTQQREAAHPIASAVGNIAGDLAAAGGIAKGETMAGRGILPAAAEGAGYGGTAGAGYARQGEKEQGAAIGALTGAITGGAMEGIGGALANRAAQRAVPAPPTADDLATQSGNLYRQSESAGVRLRPQTVNRLAQNARLAAGRLNSKLHPSAEGALEYIDSFAGKPISLAELDEIRQVVRGSIKGAKDTDVNRLMRISDQIDNMIDNLNPQSVTGNAQDGVRYLKEARQLWQRSKKTEIIDQVIDLAELKSGEYTQSGMANALRQKFKNLETRLIKNAKEAAAFNQEERQMIRQLAEGKASGAAMRWLARFAPRGPVSFLSGLGSYGVAGPAGLALPAAGQVAAGSVDRAAINAAQTLAGNVARGGPAVLPQIPNRLRPFLPGSTAITGGQLPPR